MSLGREKVSFLGAPTPLEYLSTMSQKLGIHLYIKRDDLLPLGAGGNKLRKLEYLLADAKAQGATVLLTTGGAQTNHGRLTAAVAAKFGMKCVIACLDEYPGEISANILLDRIMGAEVVLKKDDGRDEDVQLRELFAEVTARYEAQGEKVYFIPMGGSNVVGVPGYYDCAVELTRQAEELQLGNARVVCTVGSLGTYMGLYTGLRCENSPLSLTGIAILPQNDEHIMAYWKDIKETFDLPFDAERKDFHIETGYMREGYNLPDARVRDAIYDMARSEAILLDPCYTGKCFAGLEDMVQEGKIAQGETVILLHTGGFPGLYTKHHRVEFERELLDGVTIL
ncbi:MAG: D-cysteine desulfhydrase family protein [Oscillospiraceae bacterium]|nr:D-cysteine desulfhydrase family protein [Oscillospiraceae bacterium]